MKALSIRQPWAWLIIHAGKDCENRPRRFNHRGPLLIHASQGMTRREYDEAMNWVVLNARLPLTFHEPKFEELLRGGIVGQMNVVDCVDEHPSPWFCGPYALVIDGAKELPFYPCKGQLSLFEVKL